MLGLTPRLYSQCFFFFKTQSTSSDPSAKRPTGSALEAEMLQIGKADIKLITHFFFTLCFVLCNSAPRLMYGLLQAQYLGSIEEYLSVNSVSSLHPGIASGLGPGVYLVISVQELPWMQSFSSDMSIVSLPKVNCFKC